MVAGNRVSTRLGSKPGIARRSLIVEFRRTCSISFTLSVKDGGEVELGQGAVGAPQMDHLGHVAGHAGGRDETVEALGFEPLERLGQLLAHEFFQLIQHPLGRRRAFEELIGEPDRAQLEALACSN